MTGDARCATCRILRRYHDHPEAGRDHPFREPVVECTADEYEALAQQLHDSIAEGQTVAETAKTLRLVSREALDPEALVKGVTSDLEYMAEDEGAGWTERDRTIADAAVRTTLVRLAHPDGYSEPPEPLAGVAAAVMAAGGSYEVAMRAAELLAVSGYSEPGERLAAALQESRDYINGHLGSHDRGYRMLEREVAAYLRGASPQPNDASQPVLREALDDERLRALSDEASPGPWTVGPEGFGITPAGHETNTRLGADSRYTVALVNWHRAALAHPTTSPEPDAGPAQRPMCESCGGRGTIDCPGRCHGWGVQPPHPVSVCPECATSSPEDKEECRFEDCLAHPRSPDQP